MCIDIVWKATVLYVCVCVCKKDSFICYGCKDNFNVLSKYTNAKMFEA